MSISSAEPVPVGSSIFFTFSLLTIAVFVLLLLRRFLTLRATPAFLSVPIFLALALPASVVLLVPIDLASSSRDGGAPKGIWLPDRMVLVSWRIAYWLIFVLTWVILPLLGEFIDSGYRESQARLVYSLRSNARYQLTVLCCAVVGLIYISIQIGFDFTSIKALVMALAYVWGLVLAIYLMGHGLVSMPRGFFRRANLSGSLRRLQAHAPKVHDRLTDAVNDLEVLEAQVAQLQRRKTGTARDFEDWIEELAEGCNPPARTALVQASELSSIPAVITERYLADLTRRLQRARHQKARFVDEWDRLVRSAADIQTIMNASASKKLEFPPASRADSPLGRSKILTPYLRYHLHVNVIPGMRLVLGAISSIASICIIWSEMIKSLAPGLSIVSLTAVPHHPGAGPIGFGGQVTASAWLLYMCAAALVGVNDAKVWGNRALVRRNTYGESACWYAGLVARLTVPIAYNFLTLLPQNVHKRTTFYNFLGRLIDLTRLGKGFDFFFPMFILVPVCATFFNLYGRVKNVFGFGLAEEDDDLENDPAGYGLGGWREGRELIERELNGMGSLSLTTSDGPSSSWRSITGGGGGSGSRNQTRDSSPLLRPPAPDGIRSSSARTRNALRSGLTTTTTTTPTTAGIVDNDDDFEDENFFQSFAHRVKNTLDTTSMPRWLQGEPLRLPKWMQRGNGIRNGSGAGSEGFTRMFGGRPADGRVRL